MEVASPVDHPLSVVVPTLDEADHLPALLRDLESWDGGAPVVVADGGSRDGTRRIAIQRGCRVVYTPPGRGRQMNAGARVTATPWILFLHADSRLNPRALDRARQFASGPRQDAACFRLRIDHPGRAFRLIERGQRLRERWLGLPYGDQGLLIPRALFDQLGGFAEVPVMEDVLLARKLNQIGKRIRNLQSPIRTSPRRYVESGPWRQVARNAWCISRLFLGVRPQEIARSYLPRRRRAPRGPEAERPGPEKRVLGTVNVFAKAPRPGHVKTRLAAGIGDEAALRVYRHLLRKTVREAARSGARVVVCYDPEDGRRDLDPLVEPPAGQWSYQGDGDLGMRMHRMLNEALDEGPPAVVVGTDIPDLDAGVLHRAFRALDEADVVVGPALDGGYYLLGLKRPAPELFHGMVWSEPTVLDETRTRARMAGKTVLELEPLRDVDRAQDLTDELRRIALVSGAPRLDEAPPDPRPDR